MEVIGGRAHLNGITFATTNHVVTGINKNGRTEIRIQRLPNYKLLEILDKVPFLRGISRLIKIQLKLFLLIIIIMLIPWEALFPEQSGGLAAWWQVLMVYGIFLLSLKLLLKRLWRYHGAEHKAFNAYTNGEELSLPQVMRASRLSDRCGSNLVVILIPLIFILTFTWAQYPLLIFLVSLSVGYEIFRLGPKTKLLSPIFLIGRALQKYLVTEEPAQEEVKLALDVLRAARETLREA